MLVGFALNLVLVLSILGWLVLPADMLTKQRLATVSFSTHRAEQHTDGVIVVNETQTTRFSLFELDPDIATRAVKHEEYEQVEARRQQVLFGAPDRGASSPTAAPTAWQ